MDEWQKPLKGHWQLALLHELDFLPDVGREDIENVGVDVGRAMRMHFELGDAFRVALEGANMRCTIKVLAQTV
jgi:hypothetical protein